MQAMNQRISDEFRIGNLAHSILLLGGLFALLGTLGYALFGNAGIWVAGLLAVVTLLAQGGVDPFWLLRLQLARPLTRAEAPALYGMLRTLLARAGISHEVTLFLLPRSDCNALTVGRGQHHAIALTTGLVRAFTEREIAAILAHEISHIANRDIAIALLAGLLVQGIGVLAQFLLIVALLLVPVWLSSGAAGWWLQALVLALVAPAAATLMQMALSRTREFDADLGAARLIGDPGPMIAALVKLERMHRRAWYHRYFPVLQQPERGWLATHPATAERVTRLESLRDDPTRSWPLRDPTIQRFV